MRALIALPVLLLAAAANAQVFEFVHGGTGGSTTYEVRGAVTVGGHHLTGYKTALEYNGTFAVERTGNGNEYRAKFVRFTLGKYERVNRDINDDSFALTPQEQREGQKVVSQLKEVYEREMKRPVRFTMEQGHFVRMEADREHKQWSLNIFRAVITLLQNQAQKPTNLHVPHVEYKYEDGVAGKCKVHYEIVSQPEDITVTETFNMTKTKDFKDCMGPRPVYLHLKDAKRGCAGVCDHHEPENFLGQYEEEKTDFEMKPTPGCPVNRQRRDTLVNLNKITKYNVSRGVLDEVESYSMDIYHLFGGEMQVRTLLTLERLHQNGPQVEDVTNGHVYNNLHLRLPKEEQELDIPIYALMKEHEKHQQYPEYFRKHFQAAIVELTQLDGKKGEQPLNTPAYLIELVQAMSGMTEEEIKKTMPEIVRQQQPTNLDGKQKLERQLWIEILGKAGSKTALKIGAGLIKGNVFTPTETRRFLQDVAGFQSYPDTEMIEEILGLCTGEHKLTGTGKATACVAAGKIISKACESKTTIWGRKAEQQRRKDMMNGRYSFSRQDEQEQEQQQQQQQQDEQMDFEETMGRHAIKPELRCTTEKLNTYIHRLSNALRTTTEFKKVVAYINGLANIEKPEILPELIGYINGTAPNMEKIYEHGKEDKTEAIEFVRRVTLVTLRNVAFRYPKEVNPIVRVIFENTTETVQTRILAFDVWMNTQPAQWQVEKIMQVANKDTSLELTNYVYTALRTAMHATEPCYQLLAQRIRDAWTQLRPFDLGMEYSHLRSRSYYDNLKDYGVRGIWKMIASNTTILPTFTQAKLEQVRGPFMKNLFGAKLLVKGGDKIWDELVAKDGLLERISYALDGQMKQGERKEQNEQLLKDIAKEMKIDTREGEFPKAVLFWKLFSGEAVVPIDGEYMNELKHELLQTIGKFGKEGVSGHFVRVFMPTKAFHVEPSTVGLPVVHSTIHPIVFYVRYENLKIRFDNQQDRIVPGKFEVTGTIHPTILSLRQSRVFVADKVGETAPTMKVSNIKEFNLHTTFRVGYNHEEHRFRINFKPHFDRIYHSGHCTELNLEKNTIIDEEPRFDIIKYNQCIKSMEKPILRNHELDTRVGMTLKVTGEAHEPFAFLPVVGSKDLRRDGLIAAILNRVANKGMKHHTLNVYLEAGKQTPINEWDMIIDMDSNLEQLAKIPLREQVEKIHKVKVQYKPRAEENLAEKLREVLNKVEKMIEKQLEKDSLKDETTVEKQLLIKIEGRYNGQPKKTVKIAMKKVHNLEKTEQKVAIAVEQPESRKGAELHAEVSYPKIGSPFHYDPAFGQEERMNGSLVAKLQGNQEQIYKVEFNATKSEEQLKQSKLEWFEIRCLADQKAGKTMTDPCKKAILKQNSLDRMEMDIQLPSNVSPKMKQFAKQLLDAIKYKYYSQMRSEIVGRYEQQQQQGQMRREKQIRVVAEATRQSPWTLLYNVRVEMPRENVTLHQIRVRGVRPVHTLLTQRQQLKHVLLKGQGQTPCVLGERGVRTYDNVTFGLDVKPECEYVLTRDCQGTPDFTVTFAVVRPDTFTKKVRVQLVNTEIELHPFTTVARDFVVFVNGTQHKLTFDHPIVFHYAAGRKVFIHAHETANTHHTPVVHVVTDSKDFYLTFDAFTVQTFVDRRYKGVTCGVCGNNDNEQRHEFIGPNGVEYEHSNEFIASYGIGAQCRVPVEKTEEKRMQMLEKELSEQIHRQKLTRKQFQQQWINQHGQEWSWEEGQWADEDDSVPQNRYTKKTAFFYEDDRKMSCFSTQPVDTCQDGYRKEGELTKKQVEAICVNSDTQHARQAIHEIRQQGIVNIGQLEQHKVGRIAKVIPIPKCVPRY